MANFAGARAAAYSSVQGQQRRQQLLGLTAFDRHKQLMADYVQLYGGALPQPEQTLKTDADVLHQSYRFIRSEADDAETGWEARLAKRYYAKLFKEYCIADLSRYKEGKIGLRWRTEAEVIAGKGQFICGAKGCDERRGLSSYEVNFAYREADEDKQALVKLRVCPAHAMQLHYRKNKALLKAQAKAKPAKAKGKDRAAHAEGPEQGARKAGAGGRNAEKAAEHAAERSPAEHSKGSDSGHAAHGSGERPSKRAKLRQDQTAASPGQAADADADSGRWGDEPQSDMRASSEQPGELQRELDRQRSNVILPKQAQKHRSASSQAEDDFEQFFEGLFA